MKKNIDGNKTLKENFERKFECYLSDYRHAILSEVTKSKDAKIPSNLLLMQPGLM